MRKPEVEKNPHYYKSNKWALLLNEKLTAITQNFFVVAARNFSRDVQSKRN